jgi:hypothetical protein
MMRSMGLKGKKSSKEVGIDISHWYCMDERIENVR